MSRIGNLQTAASARVVATQDAFVAGSNNGAFTAAIVDNGPGDSTLNIDPDYPPIAGGLSAGDVVEAQTESATVGNAVAERVSATQIRVRSFATGVPADLAYSITITKRQIG